ncbi:Protein adenylyltransferase SelO [Dirofilaria immitis]|nr:hypothetical protein [Dirofilaria immitis]
MLISSFTTTFAQFFPDTFMNFGTTRNTENPIKIAKYRRQYFPFMPYWQAIDEAIINSINYPTNGYIEKGMIAREPVYLTLYQNGMRKRIAIGQMNDRASFARSLANIDVDDEYSRKNLFRLLALNGAHEFGK